MLYYSDATQYFGMPYYNKHKTLNSWMVNLEEEIDQFTHLSLFLFILSPPTTAKDMAQKQASELAAEQVRKSMAEGADSSSKMD